MKGGIVVHDQWLDLVVTLIAQEQLAAGPRPHMSIHSKWILMQGPSFILIVERPILCSKIDGSWKVSGPSDRLP